MWNVLRPQVCSTSVLPLKRVLLATDRFSHDRLFPACLSVAGRSPMFSHLSSSLQGLWTIRAFGAQERQKHAFDTHQDLHTGSTFTHDGMTLGKRSYRYLKTIITNTEPEVLSESTSPMQRLGFCSWWHPVGLHFDSTAFALYLSL